MAYATFEQLDAWQRACRLSAMLHPHVKAVKDFTCRDQMLRASLSISSNIAEGSAGELRPRVSGMLQGLVNSLGRT